MRTPLQYFSMDELCLQIQEHEGRLGSLLRSSAVAALLTVTSLRIGVVLDEIPLDVIDVLLSCSDFEEFKILMLSFKQNETPNFEIMGDALVCGGD